MSAAFFHQPPETHRPQQYHSWSSWNPEMPVPFQTPTAQTFSTASFGSSYHYGSDRPQAPQPFVQPVQAPSMPWQHFGASVPGNVMLNHNVFGLPPGLAPIDTKRDAKDKLETEHRARQQTERAELARQTQFYKSNPVYYAAS